LGVTAPGAPGPPVARPPGPAAPPRSPPDPPPRDASPVTSRSPRWRWSDLLRRVFAVDEVAGPASQGPIQVDRSLRAGR
jgi:hypothetical protein